MYARPEEEACLLTLMEMGIADATHALIVENMSTWSKESIVSAFRSYAEVYGDPPTSAALNHLPELPSTAVVRYYFKDIAEVSEAAGLRPRKRGCPGHLLHPDCDHRFNYAKA